MAATKKTAARRVRVSFNAKTFLATATKREGSLAEKTAKVLAANVGKPMDLDALCKAVYGGKKEVNPAINNVLNGIRMKLAEAKLAAKIVRENGTVTLMAA